MSNKFIGLIYCSSLQLRNCKIPINKSQFFRFHYTNGIISRKSSNDVIDSAKMTASKSSQTFEGITDRYDGVTVSSSEENCEVNEFSTKLNDSIQKWINTNKRGIWFKVALEHAGWVPILAENGFFFHHAHRGYVMMCRWLPKESFNIPKYAHTMLGVGAIVVNDKSQILVVKEKYFLSPHWKLPGGYVEKGENIVDAAIREVYEETNIRTEFKSLISLRHAHDTAFGCSDLYIVVSLKPTTENIEKSEREIMEAEWMDLEECLNNSHMHELNKFFLQKYVEQEKTNLEIDCRHGFHQVVKKPYTVYSICQNKEK